MCLAGVALVECTKRCVAAIDMLRGGVGGGWGEGEDENGARARMRRRVCWALAHAAWQRWARMRRG